MGTLPIRANNTAGVIADTSVGVGLSIQFSEGISTESITSTSKGPLEGVMRKPRSWRTASTKTGASPSASDRAKT